MTPTTPAGHGIEVVGHRGAAAYHPGNSRSAVEAALRFGVDRIECDVRRAADGALVLVHDDVVALPNGQRRPVRDCTTDDLRRALPGLLTLGEIATLTAGRAPLLIDVKRPGYERDLIDAIGRHGLAPTAAVSSTNASTLRRLRADCPELRLGLSTGHLAGGAPGPLGRAAAGGLLRLLLPALLPTALRLADATETMLHHRVATRRLVERVHGGGRRVYLWTVNRPNDVRRAVALGVDGIISDRPDVVGALLAEIDAP